jgi:hypothetical protein
MIVNREEVKYSTDIEKIYKCNNYLVIKRSRNYDDINNEKSEVP